MSIIYYFYKKYTKQYTKQDRFCPKKPFLNPEFTPVVLISHYGMSSQKMSNYYNTNHRFETVNELLENIKHELIP
jgi:hypothetical protein